MATARTLRQFIYSLNWDTRGRGLDVVRVLKPLLKKDSTLLDAGCGEYGLATFLPSTNVTGVDIIDSLQPNENFEFLQGSILSLPFSDESFTAAASVDVLEHLPTDLREDAITELIRVAQNGVVLAFPCGLQARQVDEDFSRQLQQFDQPQPDWLQEHLQYPYPELESVLKAVEAAAQKHQRKVRTKVYYSERIKVTRLSRWLATRSKLLYMATNLTAGALHSLIPSPRENNSYRLIVRAEFE